MMKTKKQIIGLILSMGFLFLMTSTTIAAPIAGDLTLGGTKTNLLAGNYQVLAGTHIYVPYGFAFTFDPGVNIYFENATYLETDPTSVLTICDSTAFFFETDAYFRIRGTLNILGTPANRVFFDKSVMLAAQQWKGIILDHCNNEVIHIEHCTIQNAEKFSATDPRFLSGAIYVDHCNFNAFEIKCTDFTHNLANDFGGGVCIDNSYSADNFTFVNCFFKDNSSGIDGGACASYSSNSEFLDCTFEFNTSYNGGGVYLEDNLYNRIENTIFHKNVATNAGGGAMLSRTTSSASVAFLINSEFIKNDSPLGGGYFSRSYASNLTLKANDNMFKNNVASNLGGGMYVYNQKNSFYEIINNEFFNNNCNGSGGGLGATNMSQGDYQISMNTFENNAANYGGGSAFWGGQNVYWGDNTFSYNMAHYYGGGFFGEAGFTGLEFLWNSFTGNYTETNDGGAIALKDYKVTDTLLVLLNVLTNNEAVANGGAIASIDEQGSTQYYLNNMITNNYAGQSGGGVFCENHYYFENNTIADNVSTIDGGGIYAGKNLSHAKHFNNILWGNTPNQGNSFISALNFKKFKYSDIQGSGPSITNINVDPLFIGAGDYHLQTSSPCINTGKPSFSTTSYTYKWKSDIDMQTRIYSTIEMGADEIMDAAIIPTKSSGEINNDENAKEVGVQMDVYPNPANSYVNTRVTGLSPEGEFIRLYDLTGNLLGKFQLNGDETKINTEAYPTGIYILQAGSKTKKLSILH